jgi:hypothetical protein
MLSEKQKLNLSMRLGVELTEVKDVDVLLERILREARKLVTADALGSRRTEKERWEETQVLEELNACSGTFFDPEIVDLFFSSIETIRSISERYPNL